MTRMRTPQRLLPLGLTLAVLAAGLAGGSAGAATTVRLLGPVTISPIITTMSVSSSFSNACRTVLKSVPLTGSPPIPTHVDCPSPSFVIWDTAS